MRRLLALALGPLAALLPHAISAQALRVGSGAHEGFDRLVLPAPGDAAGAWSLVPRPGGVELRLPGDPAFDLAGAFDRIARTRVAALMDEGGGRLAVAVACACHVRAFLHDGAWIVIDVADGPAPAGEAGVVLPGLAGGPSRPAPAPIPLLAGTEPRPPLLPAPAPPPGAPGAPGAPWAPEGAGADAEGALLQGLADAASQGLLDLATLAPPQAAPPAPPGGGARALDSSAVPAPEGRRPAPGAADPPRARDPLAEAAGGPGIALRTASDRGPPRRLSAEGAACLPPEALDLASWAPSGDLGAEMGARSAALTDGRDRLDPDGVEALARAYLAFGFGREARATLSLDGRRSGARDLLLLLAALVDGEPAPPGALADQAGCAGPQALWRALARGTLDGTTPAERTAAERALARLPPPLRAPLSVRAAALFAAAGDPLTAEALMAGGKAPAGPQEALVAAEVAADRLGPEAGLDRLGVAAAAARPEPAALVALVDASLAEGRPLPPGTADLVAALRFERRGTPEAASLARAEARALAAEGRFDEALALARAEGGPDRDALLREVLGGAAARLPDGAFAEWALDRLPGSRPLPAAALAPVADRLAALGFPDEAARLRASGAAASGPVLPSPEDEPAPEPGGAPSAASAPAGALGAVAAPEAAPEAAPAAPPALAGDPPSLAAGQALLDGAEAARARALALLGAAPPGG